MKPSSLTLKLELTRTVKIRAMHNLAHPELSHEENEALYGRCYRQHGHDYEVQVTITSPLDEKSGLIFERDRLDRILESTVVKPLDGADLNEIFPNTACEALVRAIYLRLRPLFEDGVLVRVSVQETSKNYFEFPPAGA